MFALLCSALLCPALRVRCDALRCVSSTFRSVPPRPARGQPHRSPNAARHHSSFTSLCVYSSGLSSRWSAAAGSLLGPRESPALQRDVRTSVNYVTEKSVYVYGDYQESEFRLMISSHFDPRTRAGLSTRNRKCNWFNSGIKIEAKNIFSAIVIRSES